MPLLSRAVHAMLASGQITRREANHMMLAGDADFQRGMARNARDQAVSRRKSSIKDAKRAAGEKATGGRRVRRNFREY